MIYEREIPGGFEKLIYVEDYPTPRPGPVEVLIRVGACAINNTDIWVREAAYGSHEDPSAPFPPGVVTVHFLNFHEFGRR